MNLREIKPEERPLCPVCKTPMVWEMVAYDNIEDYGWQFDCECIDTDRFKPDEQYRPEWITRNKFVWGEK